MYTVPLVPSARYILYYVGLYIIYLYDDYGDYDDAAAMINYIT